VKVTGWRRSVVLGLDRAIAGFSRRWLASINTFFFLYVGLPFLAPVLMAAGLRGPGEAIYTLYRPMCHQLAYRSWFFFGEKPYYLAPEFQARTGIDPYSNQGRFQAKYFAGDEVMGYKVAFCERDVAIYAGILAGGLIYGVLGKRAPRIHWLAYLIVGLGPIGLDGFSQLFSQPPYNLIPPFSGLPFRESTPLLRTLTGGLFGLMGAWFAFPYIAETMDDTGAQAQRQLNKAQASREESASQV
jgi:uncharacterized membrane protein